jgi:hypothetical protein
MIFSMSEFERFCTWLFSQNEEGLINEVAVLSYYAGPNLKERWFKCSLDNSTWRLVYPDPPFTGYWGPVE